MSARYREHAAPERLQSCVECFWSLETREAVPEYPVLPDGCVDIVYSPGGGLQVVGAMTRARKFVFPAGELQVGVRFRPGMAPVFVRAPGCKTTDRLLPWRRLECATVAAPVSRTYWAYSKTFLPRDPIPA